MNDVGDAVRNIKTKYPELRDLTASGFNEYAIHRAAREDFRLHESDFVRRLKDYLSTRANGEDSAGNH